jgi:adenylate kinase
MRIMLLGAPGVGKGSQAVLLSRALLVPHISTGDIFRNHIADKTELGIKVKTFIDEGLLVPDELTISIVANRLTQADCKNGFVLDGFPRTVQQAKFLDKVLYGLNVKLDKIINIILDDEKIIERLSGRRICPYCAVVYHTEDMPPKHDGTCTECSTPVSKRDDDDEATIRKRLKVYHEITKPMLEYYKTSEKIVTVESKNQICETTKSVFDLIGLDHKHISQADGNTI